MRTDHEARFLEQLEAGGSSIHAQDRSQGELGLLAADQRLAVHIEARLQVVGLGEVLEAHERGETILIYHQRVAARVGAERNEQAALGVRCKFPPTQPGAGIWQPVVVLVEHSKSMAGGGHFL